MIHARINISERTPAWIAGIVEIYYMKAHTPNEQIGAFRFIYRDGSTEMTRLWGEVPEPAGDLDRQIIAAIRAYFAGYKGRTDVFVHAYEKGEK